MNLVGCHSKTSPANSSGTAASDAGVQAGSEPGYGALCQHESAGSNGPVQTQESFVRRCCADVGVAFALTIAETLSCCDEREDLLVGHHGGRSGS